MQNRLAMPSNAWLQLSCGGVVGTLALLVALDYRKVASRITLTARENWTNPARPHVGFIPPAAIGVRLGAAGICLISWALVPAVFWRAAPDPWGDYLSLVAKVMLGVALIALLAGSAVSWVARPRSRPGARRGPQ